MSCALMAKILDPRGTWSSPSDYDAQAKKLAALFKENFVQFRISHPRACRRRGLD